MPECGMWNGPKHFFEDQKKGMGIRNNHVYE